MVEFELLARTARGFALAVRKHCTRLERSAAAIFVEQPVVRLWWVAPWRATSLRGWRPRQRRLRPRLRVCSDLLAAAYSASRRVGARKFFVAANDLPDRRRHGRAPARRVSRAVSSAARDAQRCRDEGLIAAADRGALVWHSALLSQWLTPCPSLLPIYRARYSVQVQFA